MPVCSRSFLVSLCVNVLVRARPWCVCAAQEESAAWKVATARPAGIVCCDLVGSAQGYRTQQEGGGTAPTQPHVLGMRPEARLAPALRLAALPASNLWTGQREAAVKQME